MPRENHWSAEDDRILSELVEKGEMSTHEIAAALGRTYFSIHCRARVRRISLAHIKKATPHELRASRCLERERREQRLISDRTNDNFLDALQKETQTRKSL